MGAQTRAYGHQRVLGEAGARERVYVLGAWVCGRGWARCVSATKVPCFYCMSMERLRLYCLVEARSHRFRNFSKGLSLRLGSYGYVCLELCWTVTLQSPYRRVANVPSPQHSIGYVCPEVVQIPESLFLNLWRRITIFNSHRRQFFSVLQGCQYSDLAALAVFGSAVSP